MWGNPISRLWVGDVQHHQGLCWSVAKTLRWVVGIEFASLPKLQPLDFLQWCCYVTISSGCSVAYGSYLFFFGVWSWIFRNHFALNIRLFYFIFRAFDESWKIFMHVPAKGELVIWLLVVWDHIGQRAKECSARLESIHEIPIHSTNEPVYVKWRMCFFLGGSLPLTNHEFRRAMVHVRWLTD